MPRKQRIVCLHGSAANTDLMELQTGALQVALEDIAEFEFLRGPYEAMEAADEVVASMVDPPFYMWWDDDASPEAERAVARDVARRHRDSLANADFLLGFSQGACAATLVALELEALAEAAGESRRLRGVVCVCGVLPEGDGASAALPRLRLLPSIHVLGSADEFYPESLELAQKWYGAPPPAEDGTPAAAAGETADGAVSATVLTHKRGHCFPADIQPLAKSLRALLERSLP
eukprot:TRINITY_DN14758_c0_g1_i2.p1 TRINITY_DN14758_c0_g1~~TRINITY_DN14758_c0_g1_i2.p1  ORF type:complete len:233 (-),score=61.34 TRINITY_DN14758_c0_g1_i2:105-803(-)